MRRAAPVTAICTGRDIEGTRLSLTAITERMAAASLYTAGQAGDELTLEHEEDDERRQRRQHGREQHRAIVRRIGGEQHRDDQGDGLVFVGLDDDERPQIIVPAERKYDDGCR